MIPSPRQDLSQWCRARQIDLMVLFGSRATGKTHRRSDTDLAVFSTTARLRENVIRLYGEVEDLFGIEIDLAIIDEVTDPLLRLEVFQKGKCLYEAQPGMFLEQKILALHLYEDSAPLRRLRDEVLRLRLEELKHVTTRHQKQG